MAKRKPTVSQIKKKAWVEFSKYIRTRDNTTLGCRCFTCGKYYPFKLMQAGHYISRRINITLFNEMNVQSQCYNCNINLRGSAVNFRENLVKEYGEDKVKYLESTRNNLKQWKVYELTEIYEKYKALNKTNETNN